MAAEAAIEQLRAALEKLELRADSRAALTGELERLTQIAHEKKPDPEKATGVLKRFASLLKTAGVVLTSTVALGEPLKRLAEWLHVPLHVLGL